MPLVKRGTLLVEVYQRAYQAVVDSEIQRTDEYMAQSSCSLFCKRTDEPNYVYVDLSSHQPATNKDVYVGVWGDGTFFFQLIDPLIASLPESKLGDRQLSLECRLPAHGIEARWAQEAECVRGGWIESTNLHDSGIEEGVSITTSTKGSQRRQRDATTPSLCLDARNNLSRSLPLYLYPVL